MLLTREELTALRDAIDMTLALPDSIRDFWLNGSRRKLRSPTDAILTPLCSRRRARSGPAPLNRPRRKRPSDGCSPRWRTIPGSASSRSPMRRARADRRPASD
jgi:hypothetical protein